MHSYALLLPGKDVKAGRPAGAVLQQERFESGHFAAVAVHSNARLGRGV